MPKEIRTRVLFFHEMQTLHTDKMNTSAMTGVAPSCCVKRTMEPIVTVSHSASARESSVDLHHSAMLFSHQNTIFKLVNKYYIFNHIYLSSTSNYYVLDIFFFYVYTTFSMNENAKLGCFYALFSAVFVFSRVFTRTPFGHEDNFLVRNINIF